MRYARFPQSPKISAVVRTCNRLIWVGKHYIAVVELYNIGVWNNISIGSPNEE
jgi:hypothetical protein